MGAARWRWGRGLSANERTPRGVVTCVGVAKRRGRGFGPASRGGDRTAVPCPSVCPLECPVSTRVPRVPTCPPVSFRVHSCPPRVLPCPSVFPRVPPCPLWEGLQEHPGAPNPPDHDGEEQESPRVCPSHPWQCHLSRALSPLSPAGGTRCCSRCGRNAPEAPDKRNSSGAVSVSVSPARLCPCPGAVTRRDPGTEHCHPFEHPEPARTRMFPGSKLHKNPLH